MDKAEESRFQITKRKTKGYNLIEFSPHFGGQQIRIFKTKRSAEQYTKARKKYWK